MTEHLLERKDVSPILDVHFGKGVPQCVCGNTRTSLMPARYPNSFRRSWSPRLENGASRSPMQILSKVATLFAKLRVVLDKKMRLLTRFLSSEKAQDLLFEI